MKTREKGFSLIELMMVIGLSSIMFYALAMAMRGGSEQLDSTGLRMNIQESAREGLHRIVQEIRQSAPTRITIGAGGNSVQFRVPDPANPTNADYTPNWVSSRNISYTRGGTGNQVIRTDTTTGATQVVANDVVVLNFTGNGAAPTLVTVTMSVQRTLTNGKVVPNPALQLSAQARVRNV